MFCGLTTFRMRKKKTLPRNRKAKLITFLIFIPVSFFGVTQYNFLESS